jgi:hypothetical protein
MTDHESLFESLSNEANIVRLYLEASMKPDPVLAATYWRQSF